jgi:hypothetical protein
VAPAPPAGSSRGLLVGVVVALLVVAGGAWGLRSYVLGRPAPSPPPRPEAGSLARKAIDSQVEVARRRLDAGSYRDAVREAEVALKLDPQDSGAQKVLQMAQDALKAIEDAAAALRTASAGGDAERVAGAAFDLMKLDPGHPEAETAATTAGPAFRARVDEARRLEQEARRAAERDGADGAPAFAAAAELERKAQQALQAGQPVAAARRFLEARLGFERARRSRS